MQDRGAPTAGTLRPSPWLATKLLLALGAGGLLVAVAGTGLEVALSLLVAVVLVTAVLGKHGIPLSEPRSRLPAAAQGVVVGGTLTGAVLGAVEGLNLAWLVVVVPLWFPAVVPARWHRFTHRPIFEPRGEQASTGSRWQDRPLDREG